MAERGLPVEQRKCWGCGKPDDEKAFQCCQRCIEENLTPCYFCSRQCQKASWPRHKKWHSEAAENIRLTDYGRCLAAQNLEQQLANDEAVSEYTLLCRNAAAKATQRKFGKACKLLHRAIALAPEREQAYRNLATTYDACDDPVNAVKHYVLAADRAIVGTPLWAVDITSAFDLSLRSCVTQKPVWWNDTALLQLSGRALDAVKHEPEAWQLGALWMRAVCLLGAYQDAWDVGARSPQQLLEGQRVHNVYTELRSREKDRSEGQVPRASCNEIAAMMSAESSQADPDEMAELLRLAMDFTPEALAKAPPDVRNHVLEMQRLCQNVSHIMSRSNVTRDGSAVTDSR